jgi:hypothetical protein
MTRREVLRALGAKAAALAAVRERAAVAAGPNIKTRRCCRKSYASIAFLENCERRRTHVSRQLPALTPHSSWRGLGAAIEVAP